MKEQLLIKVAAYVSFSILILKTHAVSGWFISLMRQATHTSSCPVAIESLNRSTAATLPFCLVNDLDESVAGLSQMKTLSGCCRGKSFLLAVARRDGAAGDQLLSLQQCWLWEGQFGSSRCCSVSFQTSPFLSHYGPLSDLFRSVVYGLCPHSEASRAVITLGNLLLLVFRVFQLFLILF